MMSLNQLQEHPVGRAPLTNTDHAQTDDHDLYSISRSSSIPVCPVAVRRTPIGHEVHVYRHVARFVDPSKRMQRTVQNAFSEQ